MLSSAMVSSEVEFKSHVHVHIIVTTTLDFHL
jgi:hypothetical protein